MLRGESEGIIKKKKKNEKESEDNYYLPFYAFNLSFGTAWQNTKDS